MKITKSEARFMRPGSVGDLGYKSLWANFSIEGSAAKQAAEKVDLAKILVGQALLTVRVLLHLPIMGSQEWLSYWTFFATCKAVLKTDRLPRG